METPINTQAGILPWSDASAYTGREVIFIVGSPRSGTTWLQRLMASHPNVSSGQESHLFEWFLGPMLRKWHRLLKLYEDDASKRSAVGLAAYLTTEQFQHLLRAFVSETLTMAQVQPGDLFLEKTPSHALFLKEILELLPDCRVIHLVRDPRDVTASLLAASTSWGKGWAPKTANDAALIWKKHVDAVEDAKALMRPDQFIELRYEDLHSNTAEHLQKLATFAELEWDEAAIHEAIDRNSADKTRKGEATPLPVFGQHSERTKEVAKEPEGFVRRAKPGGGHDLSSKQKREVRRQVLESMQRYGYTWERTGWF